MAKHKISDFFVPTAKQKEVLPMIGKGYRILYGGSRGGGKSALALYAAVVAARKFPGIQIVAIRQSYPELEEVFINKLKIMYPENIFGYVYREKYKTATFHNKSRILFRSCENEKDAKKIQGAEYQFMIIDEAANFYQHLLEKLFGSVRNANVGGFEPTILMTANPGGLSDTYFKTRFIRPDHKVWTSGEVAIKDKYVFVSAKVQDNPHLGEDYIQSLNSLNEKLKQAWLHGNWDVLEGQFFDMWDNDLHVIEPFDVPKTWRKFAGLDLGYTKEHPTVFLELAEHPETQTLYVTREYYGEGAVETHIRNIKTMYEKEDCPLIYADPSMFDNSRKFHTSDESPALMFQREGMPMVPANNSRVNGWRILKQWLHHNNYHKPRLYIFDTCPLLIQTLPLLRYSNRVGAAGEDLDTKQADDAADALRYALISGGGMPNVVVDIADDQFYHKEILPVQEEKMNTPMEFNHFFGSQYDQTNMSLMERGYNRNVESTLYNTRALY